MLDRLSVDAYGDMAVAAYLHALAGDVFGTEVIQFSSMKQKRRHACIAAAADRIFRHPECGSEGTDMERKMAIIRPAENRHAGRLSFSAHL